ncbi:hypothetical protein H072_4890 [Dactylellina haptotyla CBS 200.50]|uniref:Uncharacterized protein n=1 Tax=Dactylellina haptotyla (strain CBS 200.50) TaxID=1284197 RepID=S8AE44_DACHA|nr:hypothetical protein H072_4890 [Dactylellina haptotyla CBS 200.50]
MGKENMNWFSRFFPNAYYAYGGPSNKNLKEQSESTEFSSSRRLVPGIKEPYYVEGPSKGFPWDWTRPLGGTANRGFGESGGVWKRALHWASSLKGSPAGNEKEEIEQKDDETT